ncbi:hypothetical protein [Salinimicrobium xinjiangense]|uniref:hypothetical protein n=1 Tax=Salinimicrobium xinjiangense TaxID=438596 RepID=UPI0004915A62|nr:hypothetical protein [Salinimicrobium xinjiangense]
MLRICTKILLPVLLIFLGTACEPEHLENPAVETVFTVESLLAKIPDEPSKAVLITTPEDFSHNENLQDLLLNAISPTECGATKLAEVSGRYFEKLLANPEALDHLAHYKYLNRQAAKLGIGSDYYGSNSIHTQFVGKLERDLERFWNIDREINILGQHNQTLEDRESLADIYWYSINDMESKEEAYRLADAIIALNQKFPELIRSPFISSDGFAAQNGKIVVGDGLIKLFAETGLQNDIVWTGIVTHEWAHQIQFHFMNSWYPSDNQMDAAERTRMLELEADFFSGYYMTHKRGATFNWKRAEEFFELFYQAGDCSFEFEQHHGTPLQRKQASFEGYLLAEAAKKKGQILSPQELHDYFLLKVLPETVRELQYF